MAVAPKKRLFMEGRHPSGSGDLHSDRESNTGSIRSPGSVSHDSHQSSSGSTFQLPNSTTEDCPQPENLSMKRADRSSSQDTIDVESLGPPASAVTDRHLSTASQASALATSVASAAAAKVTKRSSSLASAPVVTPGSIKEPFINMKKFWQERLATGLYGQGGLCDSASVQLECLYD